MKMNGNQSIPNGCGHSQSTADQQIKENNSRNVNDLDDSKQSSKVDNPRVIIIRKAEDEEKCKNLPLPEENGMSRGIVLNPLQFFRSRRNFKWTPSQSESTTNLKDQEMTNSVLETDPSGTSPPNGNQQQTSNVVIITAEKGSMSLLRKMMFGFSFVPMIISVVFMTVLIPCEIQQEIRDSCCGNASNVSNSFFLTGNEALLFS